VVKFGNQIIKFREAGAKMEIGYDRIREYIVALMKAGSFSYEDAANLSGTPVQTVRNIATGKTPDPKFATIAKIIISLGGDLNEIVGYEKKKEIEVNSTVSLKETYEMRIADLIKSYEERIEDVKAFSDLRVADLKKLYEERMADMKNLYEERLAELRAAK
jgi:transcriptional regulator with XRE-family HTH domain